MKYYIIRLLFLLSCFVSFSAYCQEDEEVIDLDAFLDIEESTTLIEGTFKNTRIINCQSTELATKGTLMFEIGHRFGAINSGSYSLFGLDDAGMRMGFNYGLSKNLAISTGRSTFNKTYDGSLKYRIAHQQKGDKNIPITMVFYTGYSINTADRSSAERSIGFTERLSYYNQLLISRKFSSSFSLQIMPIHIHRNVVNTRLDQNDLFGIGTAYRYKLSTRFSCIGEYTYLLPSYSADQLSNALSLGIEIETGGHVFQLHFSNAQAIIDTDFLGNTTGTWGNGNIHFGFNLTRVFGIQKNN